MNKRELTAQFQNGDSHDKYKLFYELLDKYAALETAGRKLVNNLPTQELDLARDIWGNTNTRIVKEARNELAALLDA